MSSATVEATEFICDNPSCGVKQFSSTGVPDKWYLVAFQEYTHFCSRECIRMFLGSRCAERRDGSGWVMGGLPGLRR